MEISISDHPSTCIARPEEIICIPGTPHKACEVCGWHTSGFENIALLSSHADRILNDDGTLNGEAVVMANIEDMLHFFEPGYAEWRAKEDLRIRVKQFQRKWLKPRRTQTMQPEDLLKIDDLQQVTAQVRGNSHGGSHPTGKLSTATCIKGTTSKVSPKRDDVSSPCTPRERERLLVKLQNPDTKQMHNREAAKLLEISERQVRNLKDPKNKKKKLIAAPRLGFVTADSLRRYLGVQTLQPRN